MENNRNDVKVRFDEVSEQYDQQRKRLIPCFEDFYHISAAYERTKLDRMTTLDQQILWLNDIGFSDVDCVYKHYNFVVLLARKI